MKKLTALLFIISTLFGCSGEPQSVEQLVNAGEKAIVDGDFARARDYLSKAIARQPSDQHILYLLGTSYRRDFLYDSAYYYLKRADLLHPGDREVNLELHRVAAVLQEWKSAVRAIHVLIETGDSKEMYIADLADYNLRMDNFSVAYHYYRRLSQIQPDNIEIWRHLVNLAAQLDSLEVALRVVDSALERFGRQDGLLISKGLCLAATGDYDQSESIFRSLVAKDTASVAARINLAHTLSSQNSPAKKREALQLYLQVQPRADKFLKVDSLIEALTEELDGKK
ncbi:MAG: tetratricopeptide repeat protein [bacterium]